ncbi:MAG: response regulator transcription factor [Butyrivibrio sp.]|nr:response regulator transcription factor [Butyrivibrio sp.]
MIKIAICDDDIKLSGKLETLLNSECLARGIRPEIDVYYDGTPLARNVIKGDRYSIIFMDIEMKELDGITTARMIRTIDRDSLIIYVSSYESYLKELFEVEPFRFLSKPIDEKIFKKYFSQALSKIDKAEGYFQYTYNRKVKKTSINNIVYFESKNRVITIHFNDGTSDIFYGKLNDIQKELECSRHCFFRIHQSYLVNYKYVCRMNYSSMTITYDGKEFCLKISENRQKEVRKRLVEMVGNNNYTE